MSNPSKQKGTAFETLVATYLREVFPSVERAPAQGSHDRGDIFGVPGFTVECKNRRDLAAGLAEGVDQAVAESVNAGTSWSVAVVKRPRRGEPGDQYAVMPLWQFRQIAYALSEGASWT